MKKALLISPKNRTVYNFRGELIREIIAKGYEVVVTGPDRTDVGKIYALGARFVEIPLEKNGTSVLGDLRYCLALLRVMRQEKPYATLGYTVKPAIYGALAAWLAGVNSINSMITGGGYALTANTFKARMIGKLVRLLYRLGLSRADHVIFQNPDDRNEFVARHLVRKDKCSVVNGSGVDTAHFSPAPFPDIPTFFMLSRLLKSKGVGEYLEAARIVKAQRPGVRFLLLGKVETAMQDALDRDYVEGFIHDGVIERFDETDDVRPYYAMCSVYVLPSYREGTPRTVLEAMSMQRPVLTTDVQGCRETVRDGVNGFLVPARNVQALVDKMNWFLDNPDNIPEMGARSRAYAEEKFEVKKVNADMLRIMRL